MEEDGQALGELAGGEGGGGVFGPEGLDAFLAGGAGRDWGECRVFGEAFGGGAGGEGEELADYGPEAVTEAGALDPGAVGVVVDGLDDGEEGVDEAVDGGEEGCQQALQAVEGCGGGAGLHSGIMTIFLRWSQVVCVLFAGGWRLGRGSWLDLPGYGQSCRSFEADPTNSFVLQAIIW